MPKTLGLSSPVYEIPFDDNTVLVIGRIAIMWGQIVFHLDTLLKLLKGMSIEQAAKYETRSLKAKLADLTTELSKPENKTSRRLLQQVHQKIDQVASDRNVVFHGLWGVMLARNGKIWRIASKSYSRESPFYADDLKPLHERMIGAAEALDAAFYGLGLGLGPQPKQRNRRQAWMPREVKASDPPPPRRFPR
jgi:hypothetical protein